MRARFRRLSTSELEVLAMRVPEEVSRADVRDALGARLAEEGLLADDAITDHLQLASTPSEETIEASSSTSSPACGRSARRFSNLCRS